MDGLANSFMSFVNFLIWICGFVCLIYIVRILFFNKTDL